MAETVGPIALVVCEAGAPRGPLYFALAHEGFDPREVSTTEEAEALVEARDARSCVVVLDAEMLPLRRGRSTWDAFLRARAGIPLVVASRERADEATRSAVRAARGMLVEGPFDAAAVVAAAQRACPGAPARARRRAAAPRGAGATA
jgi:DNA-binding NtrC family response regulator